MVLYMFFFSKFALAQELSTVKLAIDGIENKTVYLSKEDVKKGNLVLDSVVATNSKVVFTRNVEEPNLYTIEVEDTQGLLQFIWDNDVLMSGRLDSLWNAKITGSKLTAQWQEYQEQFVDPLREQLFQLSNEMRTTSDSLMLEEIGKKQRAIMDSGRISSLEYIRKYPESFTSLYLLNHYAKGLKLDRNKKLLDVLSPYWQNHTIHRYLSEWLANKVSLSENDPAPPFSATTFSREKISLDQLKGNYVILDFWGTWCGPCIAVIPELKAIYDKYRNQSVKLVSVACEIGKDEATMLRKVQKFVTKREMDWIHILENKANADQEESLIHLYGIEVYPTTVLISPEGKILFSGGGKRKVQEMLDILEKELL